MYITSCMYGMKLGCNLDACMQVPRNVGGRHRAFLQLGAADRLPPRQIHHHPRRAETPIQARILNLTHTHSTWNVRKFAWIYTLPFSKKISCVFRQLVISII